MLIEMKKVILFFAVAAAFTFASCGSKAAKVEAEPVVDETTIVVPADTTPVVEDAPVVPAAE
jgi:hypothetical protein